MDYVLLAFYILVSLAGLVSLVFGLPGTFVILGASVLYGWYGGFSEITVRVIIILVVLALAGELIEFLLGILGSKKYESSNRAIVGSIIFGIIGAVMGAPFFFGIGAVIGAFAGAFAGAILMELSQGKKMDEAIKSGWGAFLGRVAGTISKGAVGIAMIAITVLAVLRN
ncbi:MAG: hypothetical protein A3J42_01315 [Candidatus Dadabacteria bacterium RIFCSPHIGHO2_12_FULL_53_21]|nr:MAG: hypothetical protein A3J42_01315 [Candidatus Dadabacteria bacterium RIFCSPHIGHO2_12_FULL_53_21]